MQEQDELCMLRRLSDCRKNEIRSLRDTVRDLVMQRLDRDNQLTEAAGHIFQAQKERDQYLNERNAAWGERDRLSEVLNKVKSGETMQRLLNETNLLRALNENQARAIESLRREVKWEREQEARLACETRELHGKVWNAKEALADEVRRQKQEVDLIRADFSQRVEKLMADNRRIAKDAVGIFFDHARESAQLKKDLAHAVESAKAAWNHAKQFAHKTDTANRTVFKIRSLVGNKLAQMPRFKNSKFMRELATLCGVPL